MTQPTQIFADEIATLMPDRRIARLRDEQDVIDLAALLAAAFGMGQLQGQIAAALSLRRLQLGMMRLENMEDMA